MKNQYMGDCVKRGTWRVSRFKRGLGKKRGDNFEGRDAPMQIMICL